MLQKLGLALIASAVLLAAAVDTCHGYSINLYDYDATEMTGV